MSQEKLQTMSMRIFSGGGGRRGVLWDLRKKRTRRGLLSFGLMLDPIFRVVYTEWISFPILQLNSQSCLRTEFADLWSLNSNVNRQV